MAVFGTISVVRDLLESEKSILILGKPGVGKTTIIREIARVLADEMEKRVIIIDTSNEIAGDSDIPHSGIGRARRMQVAKTELFKQMKLKQQLEEINNKYKMFIQKITDCYSESSEERHINSFYAEMTVDAIRFKQRFEEVSKTTDFEYDIKDSLGFVDHVIKVFVDYNYCINYLNTYLDMPALKKINNLEALIRYVCDESTCREKQLKNCMGRW